MKLGGGAWGDAATWLNAETSVGEVPNNVETPGSTPRYFDVVLDQSGVTTLSDARTVDSVAISSGASLFIDPLGSLSVVSRLVVGVDGILRVSNSGSVLGTPEFVLNGGKIVSEGVQSSVAWNTILGCTPSCIEGGGTFETVAGNTLFHNGIISGGGLFSKTGEGTMVLTGANTYTYGTIIYEGRLVADGGSAIPDTSAMQVQAGAVFELAASETINNIQGGGDVFLRNNTLTIRNQIPGFSPLTGLISGTGGVTIDSVTGVVWFVRDHTYTGLTKVMPGSILTLGGINSPLSEGSVQGNVQVDGALWFFRSEDLTYGKILSGAGYVRQLGDSVLTLTGANTIANIAVGGRNSVSNTYATNSTLAIAGKGKLGNANVNVSVERGGHLNLGGTKQTVGTIQVYDGGTIDNGTLAATFFNFFDGSVSAKLTGSGKLQKLGAGALFLTGVNNYTGATDVFEGFLYAIGGKAIGDTSDVTVYLGGRLTFDGNETIGSLAGYGDVQIGSAKKLTLGGNGLTTSFFGNIAGEGELTKVGGGTFTLAGFNTFDGPLKIDAGTLVVQNGAAIDDDVVVNVAKGATLSLMSGEMIGALKGAGAVNLNTSTLVTGYNNTSSQWTGTTTGLGNLMKVGTGVFKTQSLGHTGVTQVSGGELNTTGTISGSLFVTPGGLFSGNARVAGVVSNNGLIAPGNSAGSLFFLSDYTAGATARLEMEAWLAPTKTNAINGVTHDFVSIAGNVSGRTVITVKSLKEPDKKALRAADSNDPNLGREFINVSGSVASDAFVLAAPVIAKGYQFLLEYRQDFSATSDGFFLKPHPRNEVLASAALLSTTQSLTSACFNSDMFAFDAGVDGARDHTSFASDTLRSSVDDGTKTNQNYTCETSGASIVSLDNATFGVRSGTGTASGAVAFPTGARPLEGDVTVYEAVASIERSGFILNMSAGYVTGDWTVAGMTAVVEGAVASARLGRRLDLDPLWISAVVAVDFDKSECARNCSVLDLGQDTGLLQGTAAIRADMSVLAGALRPYVQASYSDGMAGGNWLALEDALVDASADQDKLTLDAGLNAEVGAIALFAAARYEHSVTQEFDEALSATLGATMAW